MKIFKFGGASVKDAAAVINVAEILIQHAAEKIVVVISAMGKTTNALEEIVQLAYHHQDYSDALMKLKNKHLDIIHELDIELSLDYFIDLIIQNAESNRNEVLPKYYDQIVSIGELISTSIVQAYLYSLNHKSTWVDARELICTDETWQEGIVNWEETKAQVVRIIPPLLQEGHLITQGFIGSSRTGDTSTLGREGSDFTGAILANILDAEGLYIWKDVPGVLNADPKLFPNPIQLSELTYYEAIEMTYYGATVIHPKTIKPLQNKQIPLYVKSFLDRHHQGTIVHFDNAEIHYPPVIIVKKNQTLLSIRTTDFSFIAENNLAHIYEILAEHQVKVNLIQTAALSCTICFDTNDYKKTILEQAFGKEYSVKFNHNLELLTIRHYQEHLIQQLIQGKEILLTQKSRNTVQLLYQN